ncbi:MAG: FeoB-associated Cys-rich membrane protein [Isosphaeraceae bacterium]|nr:FeoB-associated Cys-rich membrane protein [Isosphaeraceae bacterium]
MGMGWQEAVVLLAVITALTYLVRSSWRALAGPKSGGGCGSCSTCPTRGAAGPPPIVSIEPRNRPRPRR